MGLCLKVFRVYVLGFIFWVQGHSISLSGLDTGLNTDGSGFYLCIFSFYLFAVEVEDISCEVAEKKRSE
jgi:hypothetical protein